MSQSSIKAVSAGISSSLQDYLFQPDTRSIRESIEREVSRYISNLQGPCKVESVEVNSEDFSVVVNVTLSAPVVHLTVREPPLVVQISDNRFGIHTTERGDPFNWQTNTYELSERAEEVVEWLAENTRDSYLYVGVEEVEGETYMVFELSDHDAVWFKVRWV